MQNGAMSRITLQNWILRLGIVLSLAGQVFAIAHASEFGPDPHEHNGVACFAALSCEQEGLVPTANPTASTSTTLVSAVPLSENQALRKRLRSIRPPSTGPPSIWESLISFQR